MNPRPLIAVGLLLVALWSVTLPGVFTLDEPNYMASLVALQHGRLSLPGTDALTASKALLYFEPALSRLASVPVTSAAPPLYAPLALPFSWLGLGGLFLLNLLCFGVTALLVFALARRLTDRAQSAWLAMGVVTLFAYNLEYALGVWPHMLAVSLVTGAFAAATLGTSRGSLGAAVLAGLLAGLATGVRYQEIVYAGALGLSLVLWRSPRQVVAFGVGLAVPLLASATLNLQRLGSFNPISKGRGYLNVSSTPWASGPLPEPLSVFWTRLVDYSTHPEVDLGPMRYLHSPHSPAFVFTGAVKKAWLQSLPWAALALLMLALVWRSRGVQVGLRHRTLRTASLVVALNLLAFSVAGYGRHDGFCFNQRYFLEMVPLAALALAWMADRARLTTLPLLLGGLLGALLTGACLYAGDRGLREHALLYVPLLLSLLLFIAWALRRGAGRHALGLVLGVSLMWSLCVHLADDIPASRRVRKPMAKMTANLAQAMPTAGHSALFAVGYWANSAAPLSLERDLVIVDALRDEVASAPQLVGELLAQGRRVFVMTNGFTPQELERMAADRPVKRQRVRELELLEFLRHD